MQSLKAIFFKIAAVAIFIVMSAIIKATSPDIPAGQAVFFRSFFAIPVIGVWLAMQGKFRAGSLQTSNPLGHLIRGLIGTSAMVCFFAALGLLPLPEVTAIGYAMPLFVVLFSAVLLGERVRLFRMSVVGMGLVGVLIVITPRLTGFDGSSAMALGVGLVLLGSVLAALAQIQIRRLVQTETTASVVFWFSVTASLLSLCTMPFGWSVPTGPQWVMLISAGVLGGGAQIMLTTAYRAGTPALLAPFDYTSMIWATLLGFVMFNEIPTKQTWIGATIVVAAGILIIWRERQLGLQRGKARPNMTPQ